ncbi:MAG TPA: oligosaccharide flippase family protein, partial [Solirubrobacteraceae bacterium]|nr:oligosaccharide flippase family protein [Solirubrobacteraceae bacterium]
MEEKAILGVPWTVLSFGANKVVTAGTTLVLARLLVPSDFGIVAITQIVLSFLFWFGGLSFASTVVLRQDLDRRGLGTALTLMLASGVAVTVIADAAAPAIAAVFSNAKVEGALFVL